MVELPEFAPPIRGLDARRAFLGGAYKEMLRGRVAKIRERYGLEAGPIEYPPELWDGEEQGELFPLQ